MNVNAPFVCTPAPDLDAPRRAGLSYAIELAPRRYLQRIAEDEIKIFRGLSRALRTLSRMDAPAARVVVVERAQGPIAPACIDIVDDAHRASTGLTWLVDC